MIIVLKQLHSFIQQSDLYDIQVKLPPSTALWWVLHTISLKLNVKQESC